MADIRVPSVGPVPARIMIVGEAPGADEVREKQPFIGAAGKLLRGCLSAVGISDSEVFFTNLVKYRPPGNELRAWFDSNGFPNELVKAGLVELKSEIEQVNPNIIIAAGNYPLKLLTGKGTWDDGYSGIGTYRGSILPGNPFTGGRKVLPTYHPAAALRNYSWKHIIQADLARAATQQRFPEIRRPRKYVLIDPRGTERDLWTAWLVSSPGTLSPPFKFNSGSTTESEEYVQVRSGEFLSGDIEYIGSRLLCLGCTRYADVAIVFATRDKLDVEWIRGILLSGIPLCFQNAMFDCSILEYFYDIACLKYLKHDTMIAMHCAYTEFPKDLGFIGSLFTEQPIWFEDTGSTFWKSVAKALGGSVSLSDYEKVYLPYNAIDVWVTHSAMDQLLVDELTDPNVLSSYTHEMALVRPLWSIGKRGVAINTPALASLKSALETESSTLLAGIALYNAGVPVNVKSPPQVANFLYGVMGVPQVGPKTPTGRWKMNDDTMALLTLKAKDERQRTAIRMVREARERLDLISKFCEIELDDDGRMRCHYDPAKTETGRLASRKFYPTGRGTNLQNVPKDTRVRAVFVPDRGKVFCYADLKSAESLVVAHITGDVEMLRLHSVEYMDGLRDGHKYVASFLLEKPIELITKDERYLGKRVRHAGNYGLGWHRLMELINGDAQKTGVSVDAAQAKSLVNKYRQLHPGLQAWWNSILANLWSTHTIYTQHGRKRIFYGRPDEILPEAIAYNPQGTVAQTLNMGLLRLDEDYYMNDDNWQRQWDTANKLEVGLMTAMSEKINRLGLEMLLQVHDAIGFQVPEKNLEDVLPLVRDLMAIPVPIKRRGIEPYIIEIPVEIQVGYNWGESDEHVAGSGLTKDGKPAKNPMGLRAWNG